MIEPRRLNLPGVVRGEPYDAQFQLWQDDDETLPYDLALLVVTLIVGSTVFDTSTGITVTPATDGSSGAVANQINFAINGQTTAGFSLPSENWYLRIEPVGVPLAGKLPVRDP